MKRYIIILLLKLRVAKYKFKSLLLVRLIYALFVRMLWIKAKAKPHITFTKRVEVMDKINTIEKQYDSKLIKNKIKAN